MRKNAWFFRFFGFGGSSPVGYCTFAGSALVSLTYAIPRHACGGASGLPLTTSAAPSGIRAALQLLPASELACRAASAWSGLEMAAVHSALAAGAVARSSPERGMRRRPVRSCGAQRSVDSVQVQSWMAFSRRFNSLSSKKVDTFVTRIHFSVGPDRLDRAEQDGNSATWRQIGAGEDPWIIVN